MDNFKRKKSRKKTVVTVVICALCLALVFLVWKIAPIANEYFSNEPYRGETVSIVVDYGDTITQIASKLKAQGVIDNETGFIYKYKFSASYYGPIQFSEQPVVIEPGMTNDDIIKLFTRVESVPTVRVIIPEGFSIDMIALRMSNHGLCSVDEFIAAVINTDQYDYEFINHIPEGNYKYKLEGFLFPSTYIFEEGISAEKIVDKMLKKFDEEYTANFGTYDNIFKYITIASMIEREAVLDSERATISGVIANRLNINMLLQIDATAVYAASNGLYDIENVNAQTVSVDSLYNTYKHLGLPPGPICNPGIKSAVAAANPQAHSFLYYHTDTSKGDGSHIFTENYEDHNATMN